MCYILSINTKLLMIMMTTTTMRPTSLACLLHIWFQVQIPATYKTSQNMVKVKPTWLGSQYQKNVYVSFRARGGADAELVDSFNQKVSIHHLLSSIDNNVS